MQQQKTPTAKHTRTRARVTNTPVTPTARPAPTTAAVLAQQAADAERNTKRQIARQIVTITAPPLPAVPDSRLSVQQYLDEIAPASIVGRMVKFAKDGPFVTHDDGKVMSDTTPFAALCDQTLVGLLKFNGPGEPPDRHMGLLYDGFVAPPRESLGDLDESKWEIGRDGKPADPFQHHIYLVLQNTETQELFTFVTSSKTGRRAVGNLLRHYDRVRKTDADFYPLVYLKSGGFQHSDPRVGFVATPVFAVAGRIPRADAAKPAEVSSAGLNDEIPF